MDYKKMMGYNKKEKVVYAFRPIFCKLISSISPKILWGMVILLIIGFIKAISTLAVEWNPRLDENKSITNPKKNA